MQRECPGQMAAESSQIKDHRHGSQDTEEHNVVNHDAAALKALGASQDVDLADFQWLDAQQIYEIQGKECVRRTKARHGE